MRLTTDDGVGLATVAAGDPDAPGLLLLHGIGGAKEDFAHHLDALAAEHRVVTFDHRGHGESDKPDDPAAYSLDRMAVDTACVAAAYELRDLRIYGNALISALVVFCVAGSFVSAQYAEMAWHIFGLAAALHFIAIKESRELRTMVPLDPKQRAA